MKVGKLLILAALLSGCSTQISETVGLEINCHARRCPDKQLIRDVLEIFHDEVLAFNPYAPLLVEWHAEDETFFEIDETAVAIGYTESDSKVVVTGFRVLTHELFHVHYYRMFGDGDADHAEGSGPWSDETDLIIERLQLLVEPIADEFDPPQVQCFEQEEG